jgi:DNA processing protein
MDVQRYAAADLLGPFNEVESKNAPETLYVVGDTSILQAGPRVSIVGSRKATRAGIDRTRHLVKLLVAQSNAVIVSGLAEGVDTAAHTSAIAEGGRTIAVIGTPLDRAYPKKNEGLQRQIQEEHLCISQFVIGAATGPWSFPLRNRTMALLCEGSVVSAVSPPPGHLSNLAPSPIC